MNHLFPPLRSREELAPPVLVVVAHPDDEVIAAGATLAWHRHQGHAVTVVHATDGAAGDPGGRYDDIAAVRRREGREALARLGVDDVRSFGLPDGALPEHAASLAEHVRAVVSECAPRTLYSFFFSEAHRDHRAVAAAVAEAADLLPPECRVLLFGVNQVVMGGTMFDVTEQAEVKQHALAAYESQLAYNDFAQKILHRDNAATVNVEDPAVRYAELFADLRPAELTAVRRAVERTYRYLLRDTEELA